MALDSAIFHFLFSLSGRSSAMDALIIFFAQSLPIILGIVAAIYLYFMRISSREKLIALISTVLAIIISRIVFGELIRDLLPRLRPMLALHLHALLVERSSSFPSGHALTLFAIGGVLWAYDRRFGSGFLTLSVVICLARVAAGVHYPSDILAGALLGLLSAFVAVRFFEPLLRKGHA